MSGFDVTRDPLPKGFLAIEASAGTGKTWTLSHLVARLLLSDAQLDLRRILVVTFTHASADELAARIRGVLADCRASAVVSPATSGRPTEALVAIGVDALGSVEAVRLRIDACLAGLDELHVGTIHGFCKQVLERAAFASGESFAAELAPDDQDLVLSAISDAWRARLWSDPTLATVAVQLEWSVHGDLQIWRRWNRHPATRIEPTVDLPGSLQVMQAAVAAVIATATPAQIAGMKDWQWMAQACLPDQRLIAGLAVDPLQHLDGLRDYGRPVSVLVKLKFRPLAEAHPFLAACRLLCQSLGEVRIAWLGWLCPQVAQRLVQTQAVAGVWTQDDLLRRVGAALDARPELVEVVRRTWSIALIDEFQDTDPVQWAIFRRCWAEDGRLIVVGDPKQAIYRFRGADLSAYLDAVRGAIPAQLTINRRSAPDLVTAVQNLIGLAGLPFLDPGIALQPIAGDHSRAHARLVGDQDTPLTLLIPPELAKPLPADVAASEIVRLLRSCTLEEEGVSRAILPRDLAVLVRTSSQGRRVRDALHVRGVPSTLAASGDVLDSEAAAELRLVLTAMARPRDGAALRLALTTQAWGRNAAAIIRLSADDPGWQAVVDNLEEYHRRWLRQGLTAAIDAWASDSGALARLADLSDGERWLTDWRHAVEVLHTACSSGGLRPAALLAWWDRRGNEDADVRRLRLEGDASAVRILTMHVAKGLEFPIVFSPWLGYRHDRSEDGALVADASGHHLVLGGQGLEDAERQVQRDDDAEQLRLAYVALTRARTRVYVGCGPWHSQGRYHESLLSSMGWWLRPSGESADDWRAASQAGAAGREQRMADCLARARALCVSDPAISLRPGISTEETWQAPPAVVLGNGLRRLSAEVRVRLDHHRCLTSFTGLLGQSDGAPERRMSDELILPAQALPADPTGMRGLARGADIGDALHRMIETWDFTVDPAPVVRRELALLGLEVCGPRQPLVTDPVSTVSAQLQALAILPMICDGHRLVLGELPDRLRRAEWEFHLPLRRVEASRMRELIAQHGGLPPAALAALPRLRDVAPGGGFLKGFVDLLAGDGTSWWVLDWKSNHLGDRVEDYAEVHLWSAMVEHGYLVQALLYLLALHRHLRHRLGARYDYATHVSGAAWVFLRGVDAGLGVWTWKPPESLIRALEATLLEEPA